MKPDDSAIPEEDFRIIVKHAARALRGSGALGRFPTPVADIMSFSRVIVSHEHQSLDGLFTRIRKSTSGLLRRALGKVLGVLDVGGRIAYIDRHLLPARQTFLQLHEAAHAVLPHQNQIYEFVEDCEKTIAPEIADHFDREANVFATEVLFQLEAFTEDARAFPFGIKVPLRLAKRYGASAYAAIRRYVSHNEKACAVLVLEQPSTDANGLRKYPVRRVLCSREFTLMMGKYAWPDELAGTSPLAQLLPSPGRRMSRQQAHGLVDNNGEVCEFVGEAFDTGYHVFLLLHATKSLTGVSIIRP